MHHRRSCPYFVPPKEDTKAWKGPVFAKDQKIGWKKLNTARSCNQCRLRHVKCSGGPCDHCRKRRETCEILGWEMKPCDPAAFIYKYVLPPPRCPTTTPVEFDSNADGIAAIFHPLELISRLENISRRQHAQLLSWAIDETYSSRPIGAHFGDDYQDHCSEDCPRFETGPPRLNMVKSGQTSVPASIASRHSSPCRSTHFSPSGSKYSGTVSSSLFSSPQSEFQVYQKSSVDELLGEELKSLNQESWRVHFPERHEKQKIHRMSLDFILSAESRYPSVPNIMPNFSRGYMLPVKGLRGPRPRLPSLKEIVGYDLTQSSN
ncbi:hypothetical protein DFH28DRAFT_942748 [Melampsora americana]|nr:hypothetical protein DFH28DRAFT_942748 [Melampsora americana]